MARALTVFKENALAKASMEEQADDERQAAETERLRNERERQLMSARAAGCAALVAPTPLP